MDIDSLAASYGDTYLYEFFDVIEKYNPQASRFLEWGSGATTRAICDVAKTRVNPFVLTIDHNSDYQHKVAELIPRYSFLHFRSINLQGQSLSQSDNDPSYASYPFLMGLKFDFIFIDGRRRMECALTAAQIATDDAVIVIHDWRRSRYQPMRALFETVSESGQFLVLRPKLSLASSPVTKIEKRVIVVPARGTRAMEELSITLPRTQAYAASVGADCRVVGEASTLPVHRLKSEALEIGHHYDRMLLLDADVLIRPGSPDIFDLVPEDKLGAMPEGQYFFREEWCKTLSNIYSLDNPIDPTIYFNSGVLLFSRSNYCLLEALAEDVIYGHPQFEQGFLNAKRAALDKPLFLLLPDFNYIPNPPAQPIDWRFSFFYHVAGSGKAKFLYNEIWEDHFGDRKTFSLKKFLVAEVRIGLLRQASEQMDGKSIFISDPTDFNYVTNYAHPISIKQTGIIAYIPAIEDFRGRQLCIFGPYIKLNKGRWLAKFLKKNDDLLIYEGAHLEITHTYGTVTVFAADWTSNGKFEFCITDHADNVEFRIYRTANSAEFSFLQVEQVIDIDGPVDLHSDEISAAENNCL